MKACFLVAAVPFGELGWRDARRGMLAWEERDMARWRRWWRRDWVKRSRRHWWRRERMKRRRRARVRVGWSGHGRKQREWGPHASVGILKPNYAFSNASDNPMNSIGRNWVGVWCDLERVKHALRVIGHALVSVASEEILGHIEHSGEKSSDTWRTLLIIRRELNRSTPSCIHRTRTVSNVQCPMWHPLLHSVQKNLKFLHDASSQPRSNSKKIQINTNWNWYENISLKPSIFQVICHRLVFLFKKNRQ
jgi:hypothetical protein